MANNKGFAWAQLIFPFAIFSGQVLGELILRPLYKRNLQPGMEPVFITMYIIGDLFFIFMTYYLISIVVNEFSR